MQAILAPVCSFSKESYLFENGGYEILGQRHDGVAVHEAHLHVELCELRFPKAVLLAPHPFSSTLM